MDRIETKIFSHLSLDGRRKTDNREVAADRGLDAKNYSELFMNVAKISYENPKFHLLFRGQKIDPKAIGKSTFGRRSSIFPTIFRPPELKSKLSSDEKKLRYERLEDKCRSVVENYPFGGVTRLKRFDEIQWAIIQHYQVAPTPLIDLTESLQVAATFATRENENDYGYVFVFGIPYSHGSISYHVDDRLVVVKLASACPPDAPRAHYQYAYFVGSFPHDQLRNTSKNAANLIVAKFQIPTRGFWDRTFKRVSEPVLFPENDQMENYLAGL